MLRVILKLYDVVVPVGAAHQVRLRAAAHSPYVLQRPQHSGAIVSSDTYLSNYYRLCPPFLPLLRRPFFRFRPPSHRHPGNQGSPQVPKRMARRGSGPSRSRFRQIAIKGLQRRFLPPFFLAFLAGFFLAAFFFAFGFGLDFFAAFLAGFFAAGRGAERAGAAGAASSGSSSAITISSSSASTISSVSPPNSSSSSGDISLSSSKLSFSKSIPSSLAESSPVKVGAGLEPVATAAQLPLRVGIVFAEHCQAPARAKSPTREPAERYDVPMGPSANPSCFANSRMFNDLQRPLIVPRHRCGFRLRAARTPAYRGSFRRSPNGVNAQHHSPPDPVGSQPVPLANVFHAQAEPVRDPAQGIPAPHPVAHQVPARLAQGLRRRYDQLVSRTNLAAVVQAVRRRDRRRRYMVFLRDRGERFARLHTMPSPAHPLVGRNVRDLRGKLLRSPLRQVQFETRVVRRRHSQ